MANLLTTLYDGYNVLFYEWADQRMASWPLVSTPWPTLFLVAIYLYFVLWAGPVGMYSWDPINLKGVMIFYNIFQILINAYLVYMWCSLGWGTSYRWLCEPIDFSTDERGMKLAMTMYISFLLKILDLMDTVFFVLRKKENQITFLHVYHHTLVVIGGWVVVNYIPSGHCTLVGPINMTIHVIMYTYYLLCLLDKENTKSLWWKKHLTQLQIIQFAVIGIHLCLLLVIPNCDHPKWPAYVFGPLNILMAALFVNFYIKTYVKTKTQ